jgi:hypothetical protein
MVTVYTIRGTNLPHVSLHDMFRLDGAAQYDATYNISKTSSRSHPPFLLMIYHSMPVCVINIIVGLIHNNTLHKLITKKLRKIYIYYI